MSSHSQFGAAGWWNGYSFQCEEFSKEDPVNERMVRVAWVFWISKHVEFFDTVKGFYSFQFFPEIYVVSVKFMWEIPYGN